MVVFNMTLSTISPRNIYKILVNDDMVNYNGMFFTAKAFYNKARIKFINEWGYDNFREAQTEAFKILGYKGGGIYG